MKKMLPKNGQMSDIQEMWHRRADAEFRVASKVLAVFRSSFAIGITLKVTVNLLSGKDRDVHETCPISANLMT